MAGDDMAAGLALSRQLMLDMLRLGLPLATELLQLLAAGYFDDLLSWAAIGARTANRRSTASWSAASPGWWASRTATDGGVGIACDAIRSAAHGHRYFGLDPHGHSGADRDPRQSGHPAWCRAAAATVRTTAPSRCRPCARPWKPGHRQRMMVDCSHANSGKRTLLNQPGVLASVLDHAWPVPATWSGNAGKPPVRRLPGAWRRTALRRLPITDGCLGWEGNRADFPRRRPAARRAALKAVGAAMPLRYSSSTSSSRFSRAWR
ncbi:hypothetical protein P4113_20840 [Pseudomonas aeruginosa]|nr:hypothetical protein [Pseudomonas aeruginosa]